MTALRASVAQPTAASTPARGAPPPAEPLSRASLGRRLGSFAIDLGILLAALSWAVLMEVAIADPGAVEWLFLAWLVLLAPLYFALYHAYGTGSTPGQLELGVSLRDARTGDLVGLGRALARAYGTLLSAGLLLPLRGRLTRSAAVRLVAVPEAEAAWPPTAAGLIEAFEPAVPAAHLVRRARSLVRAHRRRLVGGVLAVYLGLVGLAAIVAPLLLADFSAADDLEARYAVTYWIVIALALFLSGVYWAQAAIVVAAETVRTGEPDVTILEILRRALRRVNALAAAIVVLVFIWLFGGSIGTTLLTLLPLAMALARLSLVVPAIEIEDRPVLASFRRSWRLTRGRTWRVTWMLVASGLAVSFAFTLATGAGVGLAVAALAGYEVESVLGIAAGIVVGLALASVPLSWVLAVTGTAWALLYYDLRRQQAEGKR